MKILGFDSETTGLNVEKGDRLIEVALLTYDLETRALVDRYVTRIDPDRSITAAAQAVHGIAYEDLVGYPKFADLAGDIHRRFVETDMVVAHNLQFDALFFLVELKNAGLVLPSKPSIDTMTEARWATFNGKHPRLEELCFALHVPYDHKLAHGAEYDVQQMMQCLWKGIDLGFYELPIKLLKEAA